MRALITGTPVQVEGEPAEIAQLVELLSNGAVFVEHVHRWRIDAQANEHGVYASACWCGQTKMLQPFAEEAQTGRWVDGAVDSANARRTSAEYKANAGSGSSIAREVPKRESGKHGGVNPCSICGVIGHNKRTCPQRSDDAS